MVRREIVRDGRRGADGAGVETEIGVETATGTDIPTDPRVTDTGQGPREDKNRPMSKSNGLVIKLSVDGMGHTHEFLKVF